MTDLLRTAYDPELFRRQGHQLIDMLADYLDQTMLKRAFPVLPWRTPSELKEEWRNRLRQGNGESPSDLWRDIISASIHLHHPGYVGHQVVPPVPLAALSDLLSDLLNNSMAVYEVGPAATVIELIVGEWLGEKLGMGTVADGPPIGIFTSGGSIGNLTGLLAARQSFGGDTWRKGVGGSPMAVLVSQQSHYSVERAVRIMGLSEDGIIPLEVDSDLRIRPDRIEAVYNRETARGKRIFALVGNACSTSTGVYDPLPALAEFCRAKHIWFHVDGAHGAGAALTDKYRHLTEGIALADSVVVDFHKMLLCPSLTTAVLFRDARASYAAFAQKAEYLLSDDRDIRHYDIASRTLECTKKMMAVKVFLLLATFGEELFSEYITRTYDLCREFADMIEATENFELFARPQSNILCFRYRPPQMDPGQTDALNEGIRKAIVASGRFYIVQTRTPEGLFLRTTLMNPFTTSADLQELLREITAADRN